MENKENKVDILSKLLVDAVNNSRIDIADFTNWLTVYAANVNLSKTTIEDTAIALSLFSKNTKKIGEKFMENDLLTNFIKENDNAKSVGELSDGYHTFSELYHHRMILFSIICKTFKDKAWRSKLHDDGTMFDDYFIVGIDTPCGQYSYHYHVRNWAFFEGIEILEKAPPWDGHQPYDLYRLRKLVDNN